MQIEKVRATAQNYQDSTAIAKLLIWDAEQAYNNEQPEKAFSLYLSAYKIGRRLKEKSVWADASEFLGQIYMEKGMVDSAFYHFDEVEVVAKKAGDYSDLLHIRFLRGLTYLNAGNGTKAMNIFLPLRHTYDSLGNRIRVINVGYSLGKAYSLVGQHEKGIRVLMENIEMANEIDYVRGKLISFENLEEIYERTGAYRQAIQIKDTIIRITERSFQDQQGEIEEQIASQEEYQNQLLEQARLETTNLDLQQKNRNRNAIILLAVICLLVILAFAILIRRNLRREQQLTLSLDQKIEEQTRDLRQSLEEIKEANDDLRKFAFIASHTFKSGVRTVKITTELLKRKLDPDQVAVFPLLSHIDAAGTSMDEMLEGLNTYFSLRGVGIDQSGIELTGVIDSAISRVQEEFPSAQISFQKTSDVTVIGHQGELQELCYQLLKNGCHYVPPGTRPELSVDLSKKDEGAILSIRDNGIGIPEPYREQVFEAFFRLHPDDEYRGTGIGLAIASRIAGRHEGSINIVKSEDSGTIVQVVLPSSSPHL